MMFANVFSTFVSQMTHRLAIVTALAAAAIPIRAQPPHSHTAPPATAEITLMAGLGAVHHPVATASSEAQRYFDQGLSLIYSFHYIDARRSFDRAAALDPQCAMCFWGAALARGQFINHRMLARDKPGADSAMQRALALARQPHEQALIAALATRYTWESAADHAPKEQAYSIAMATIAARYPDDSDVQTLYAESLMNRHPWKLWSSDGTPADGTLEMVRVLEGVLRRDPAHVGANHYYIHAVEASPTPERALPSAMRLDAGTYSGSALHLIHMPAHVWYRVGDYAASARSAERADSVGGHFGHNLLFLFAAQTMRGDSAGARRTAGWLAAEGQRMMRRNPAFETFLAFSLLSAARFEQWSDVMATPQPDTTQRYHTMVWHWARGLALAATQHSADARVQLAEYRRLALAYPDADVAESFNAPTAEFNLAALTLAAEIALADGDRVTATRHFVAAIAAEDALAFSEPPDWIFPLRERYGRAALTWKDGVAAERAFRDDLMRNRRSPRSLAGLAASLRLQQRTYEAERVDALWR